MLHLLHTLRFTAMEIGSLRVLTGVSRVGIRKSLLGLRSPEGDACLLTYLMARALAIFSRLRFLRAFIAASISSMSS